MRGESGQSTIEALAALPAALLCGLVLVQLLAAGAVLVLADGAAEAGALAVAAGRDAEPAARAALPGWARRTVRVRSTAGEVEVAIRPPTVVPGLSGRLRVASRAWAEAP